ncbi:MAG: hypothetical protein AB7L66_09670 [Gemmatimonadales bacterium]
MRRFALLLLALAMPAGVAAQSSQFGVRGLGIPIRPLGPAALASGGASGPFDFESSLNPAAVGTVFRFATLLTSAQNFRSSTNPFGSASGRDNRFPQLMVTGPVGLTPFSIAISMSGYTDRNFALGTADTIDLRGSRVAVYDTLSSRGGLSDLRLAGGWRVKSWLFLGGGFHVITGTNRLDNRRIFADSNYASAIEQSELSYLGLGASVGFVARAGDHLALAGSYRNDGHVNIERDTAKIAETDLPTSWTMGVRWQPGQKASMALSYEARSWASADSGIRAQGGVGAENVSRVSGGVEIVRDPKNPGHRPLRFGATYGTLPFPLRADHQPHEFGLSVGTGFRFTGGRGGLDLALQQLWRSDGGGFTERATVFTLGVSIRP